MNYQQAKELLEKKGQTQLLKYYDELDEEGVLLPEEAEDALGDFVDAEGAAEDQ